MTAAPETTVSARLPGLLARELPLGRLTTDPAWLAVYATARSGTRPDGVRRPWCTSGGPRTSP